MSQPISTEDAIDQGISKYMVKIQGLIIPSLLAIIGFFVGQTLLTVNQIAADNQRFNVYIGTNNLRVDDLEKRMTKVEDKQRAQDQEHYNSVRKSADDWADFWKEYGFMFHANSQRAAKPTR